MKQKSKYQQELEKEPFYNIKDEDFGKEVKFKIDKNSFRGAFTCHGRKTVLMNKKVLYKDIKFKHSVWKCRKCKKEYLDLEQAKRYEKFIIMKKLLDEKLISMKRKINYDGKDYFFKFPKEGKMFLVEIKHGK